MVASIEPALLVTTLAIVAGVVVIAAVLARAHLRHHRALWASYAQMHGYEMAEATGWWRNRVGFGFSGSTHDARFRLDRHVVSTGKSAVTFTRVRALLQHAAPARLTIRRRAPFARFVAWFLSDRVPIAAPALDQALVARCRQPEFAAMLLQTPAAQGLTALPPRTSVTVDRDTVTVQKLGMVREPAVLDALIDITCRLAAVLGPKAA